ncbi:MAG TPA: M48 family metallopeptidase, partial [Candidatus Paceibacterota bacterium]|nr:M48 family metallopeptidase [Candidatus Paceibacterota bacterium]
TVTNKEPPQGGSLFVTISVNMWRRMRVRRRRASTVTKHYLAHKELARKVVLERLAHHNEHYHLSWNRVAIRNQRRCWGSCSSLHNLNFSYRILFLPAHLQDYIVVHEMCHLQEMNHGPRFWALVGEKLPDYAQLRQELREFDRGLQQYRTIIDRVPKGE